MNINNQQFNQSTIFRWLASNVTLGCQVADVTHGCRVAKVTFSMSTLIAVLCCAIHEYIHSNVKRRTY